VVRAAETSPQLRIKVLGPVQVLLGDSPVTFSRHKALALLVYLAVSGRVHARDTLATLLTDVATTAEAREQLRTTLKDLRRPLGDYLIVTPESIGLRQDRRIWLDVADLEAAARDAVAPADLGRLEATTALYRGEFLTGFTLNRAPEFEAWLLGERERSRALLVRVLTRLVEQQDAVGDLPAAMVWARRLLNEEPWHEAMHRRLMRLLARSGQREAALAQYEACRRALAAELGSEPQAETSALCAQIRAGPVAPPSNLPAPQAGFVDREAELAQVAERLAEPACRLLTLLGLGGSGKTSLALRAAAAQVRPTEFRDEHPFADGVYLVDLSAISAPNRGGVGRAAIARQRIATAIGRVLGLEFRGADTAAHLAAWLRERALLLLLDNMEHLLDGAELLSLLLQRAPRLKLLITSRERLRLPEEWVLEVRGLPLPADPDEVERAPASSLYLQLMRQAGASAPLDAAERAAIVRVCLLTQGLPLALVLAARWAPSLPVAAIVRELHTGLDLLAAPGPQLPERQRSMRLVLRATWGRLSKEEREAMRRLALFQPGFTREAARLVTGVALPTLLMLGEAALLGRDPGVERYTMHELVRQYATEQLATHPEEEAEMRARHATYYAGLVREVTPALRRTAEGQEAMGADIANIRLAWDWAAERGQAAILEQMLAGFVRWHELQGLPVQVVEALEPAAARLRAALAQAATPDPSQQQLLGFMLVEQAVALSWQGSNADALPLLEEAGALARVSGSPRLEGRVAFGLGYVLGRQRDLRSTLHWMQRALALARMAQDARLEADALSIMGTGSMYVGEHAQAQGYLEHTLALRRAQHDRFGETQCTFHLGLVALERGDFVEAQRRFEDALQGLRTLRSRLSEHLILHGLGQVHDEGWGRHVAAEGCFARDLAITQQIGDRTREGFALAALGRNALYQGDLERAGALLDRALSLSREVTSRASAAMALRGQSLLAHYHGDDRRARRCAEEVLEVARTTGMRREERQALRLLGHAQLGLGARQEALDAYRRAADLDEALGLGYLRAETATDLARVALAQGDAAQAAALVAPVLPDLEQTAPPGLEEPALAYLTCYRALIAWGDARADAVLATGHALLQERAGQFGDDERRARFLDALPAHRDLLAAWRARGAVSADAPAASDDDAASRGRRARLRVV
jgi:DNA-binding SARP family transcriptional activator/predicted ATPase